MATPRTNYVQAGPQSQGMSLSAATAPGLAMADFGNTLASIGEKGQRIVKQAREADEAGKMSAFLLELDKKAADFSSELLSRSDVDAWGEEWSSEVDAARSAFGDLPLSPVARKNMAIRLNSWASSQTLKLEGQVAARKVSESRAMISNAMQYHLERGETDLAREQLSLLPSTGVGPADMQTAEMELERRSALLGVENFVLDDPQAALEDIRSEGWLERNPGVTLADKNRSIQMASQAIQDRRKSQVDALEVKYGKGELEESDIDKAEFLTEKDKLALKKSILSTRNPTNEEHAKAWNVLDKLRASRESPEVSEVEYRKQFNEARSAVIGLVPPAFQGDIKQELSYLSPAGRSSGSGASGSAYYSAEDMKAVGRSVISTARDFGEFGDIDDPEAKGEAYLKATQIQARYNKWLNSDAGKKAGPEEAALYAAGLVLDAKSGNQASRALRTIPGAGSNLMPADPRMLQLPTTPTQADSSLLPPREQLNNRLND